MANDKKPKDQISAAPALIQTAVNPTAAQKANTPSVREHDAKFQHLLTGLTADAPEGAEEDDIRKKGLILSLIWENKGDMSFGPDFNAPFHTPVSIGDRTYTNRADVAKDVDHLSNVSDIAHGNYASLGNAHLTGAWARLDLKPMKVDANFSLNGSFEQAFQIVLSNEGGFANNKADRGGATIFGIASRSNPAEYAQIMDQLGRGDKAGALQTTMDTYKHKYWDNVAGINTLSPSAKLVAFDAAINHGPGFANQMIAATHGNDDAMIAFRARKYEDIIDRDASQGVFANSWGNRLSKLNALTTTSEHNAGAPSLYRAPAPQPS